MPFRSIKNIVLFLLVTIACNLLNISPEFGGEVSDNPAEPETKPTARLSATPTSTPNPPSPTPLPTEAMPTPTALVATNAPQVDFDDLTPYRQAMLPEFVEDVDRVAAAGASRYHLEIGLDAGSFDGEDEFVLNGLADIRYTNTEDVTLSEIYFRLYPNLASYGGRMVIEAATVDGQTIETTLDSAGTALRLPLNPPLAPGVSVEVDLAYHTTVPRQPAEGYNVFSYTGGALALAGFYPAIAVYDDEGWNIEAPPAYGDTTYLDVSLYQVELTVPEQMVVAASGSLIKEQANDDGTKTLFLASGPMRDFYIAMRADYEVVSEMVGGTLVNSYYPPDLEAGGILALRYAADALRIFNQRFGPYPYAEFDVAATPTLAGGVEYPGIVVVNQALYDQPGGFFQHATAHEVAHQWWYGLVGNDQIDEPWLDESLTNYSTAIYWQEAEGSDAATEIIETFFVRPYELAAEQDRAVIGPVKDFSATEYGLFVYSKGPLFFNALRADVGDETYFEIMRTYYSEYKYKIAQSDDLLELIERVSEKEVDSLVEGWLQNP